jgi:hypothetical protein
MPRHAFWKIILLSTTLVAIVLPAVGCGPKVAIHANVTTVWFGQIMNVQNNDTFDWTLVVLTLNKMFTYKAGTIPAGETRTVNASDFRKTNGTQFEGEVQTLTIDCQTPKGKASWTGDMPK